jgi:hypothetical protein
MRVYFCCNTFFVCRMQVGDIKTVGFVFFGFIQKLSAHISNKIYAFPTFVHIVL